MKITGDWITAAPTQSVMDAFSTVETYFVGGCVRNALLGIAVSDIDIATAARPEQAVELAEKAGLRAIPTGIEHGTITVVSKGVPHEITTYRRDVATDGRRAVVAFSDKVEDDARRRDFTINALYADRSGTVLDPLGTGLPDLEARRIRFIENAEARIREDYLRILRFFRFWAWYADQSNGFEVETLAAIAGTIDGLDQLSRERVGAEAMKLLAAPDPAPAVATMSQVGVLAHILPGASSDLLAPLVDAEAHFGFPPDPVTRLAAIGGQDAQDALRLSNAAARQLSDIQTGLASDAGPTELVYRFCAACAQAVIAIRAASGGPRPDPAEVARELARGSEAVFPVGAGDLMPELKGKALGEALRALEETWIASGFEATKEELLAGR